MTAETGAGAGGMRLRQPDMEQGKTGFEPETCDSKKKQNEFQMKKTAVSASENEHDDQKCGSRMTRQQVNPCRAHGCPGLVFKCDKSKTHQPHQFPSGQERDCGSHQRDKDHRRLRHIEEKPVNAAFPVIVPLSCSPANAAPPAVRQSITGRRKSAEAGQSGGDSA